MKINKLLSSNICMLSVIFISNIFVNNIYSKVKVENKTGSDAIVEIKLEKGGNDVIILHVPAGTTKETKDDQFLGTSAIKKEVKVYFSALKQVKKNYYDSHKDLSKKYDFIDSGKGWGYLLEKNKDSNYAKSWAHSSYYGIECPKEDLDDQGKCKKAHSLTNGKKLTAESYKENISVTEPNLNKNCSMLSCAALNETYTLTEDLKSKPPKFEISSKASVK